MLSKNGSFEHQETKSSSRRAGGETDQEQPEGEAAVREVPPGLEAPRRVRDTGTRVGAKRTLSRGVEAAREGAPQNVSFEYSVSNWRESTIGSNELLQTRQFRR